MPMMMTWTRRSSLMPEMVAFTSSMAPVSRSRFKMVKAPKTISTILRPSLMPFHTRGSRTFTMSAKEMRSTLKKVKASTMVQRNAMGETFFADCLKPRMPTKTTRIGLSAMTKLKNSMGVCLSFSICCSISGRCCRPDSSEQDKIKKAAPPNRRSRFSLRSSGRLQGRRGMSALHRDPVRFSFETQYQQNNGQNNNGRQQQASVQNQRNVGHIRAGERSAGILRGNAVERMHETRHSDSPALSA